MAEHVIVRQDSTFQTEILATAPEAPESAHFHPVTHVQELTPYGMLLSSLGSCTAILLNSYAQNHGLELQEVELRLHYARNFREDCDNCEEIDRYEEHIREEITLTGELSGDERKRLFRIAHNCPIQAILEQGITVDSQLAEHDVAYG